MPDATVRVLDRRRRSACSLSSFLERLMGSHSSTRADQQLTLLCKCHQTQSERFLPQRALPLPASGFFAALEAADRLSS